MTPAQAERARLWAELFVEGQDLQGWSYRLASVGKAHDGMASVVFDTYSPEGNLVDGPVVVIVDLNSGVVSSLEDHLVRMGGEP